MLRRNSLNEDQVGICDSDLCAVLKVPELAGQIGSRLLPRRVRAVANAERHDRRARGPLEVVSEERFTFRLVQLSQDRTDDGVVFRRLIPGKLKIVTHPSSVAEPSR